MSNDAQPPRMLSAPLKLTKMTLRGLGPYLKGAELEIKPLTILCGENGSGKSTWIDTLRLIKNTVTKREEFPFCEWFSSVTYDPTVPSYDATDPDNEGDVSGSCFERGLLNANLLSFDKSSAGDSFPLAEKKQESLAARERRVEVLNEEDDDRSSCGPAGCVGFEMEVQTELNIRDLQRSSLLSDAVSAPQQLLWLGKMAAGSKVRLRLARPSIPVTAVGCGGLDGLWDLIELTLNSQFTIHLRRSLDRNWSRKGQGQLKDAQWAVYCSKAFLPSHTAEETEGHDIAYVDLKGVHVEELCDSVRCSECRSASHADENKSGVTCDDCRKTKEMIESLVSNFRQIFRQLTKDVLAGFFPIGPIREIHKLEVPKLAPSPFPYVGGFDYQPATLENSEAFQTIPDQRCVGEHGEHSQELFSYWAYNLMCQPEQSQSPYWFETFVSYWLDRLVQTRIQFATFPGEQRPDSSILEGNQPLNGSLIDRAFNWPREGRFAVTIENAPYHCTSGFRDLSRSVHPRTSTKGAAWHVMSTGFHQLAPIVVQAGLLHQNEIMAVENPEAHLHPSLQIKVAEFLMHQANAGKFMLIETHSDLIVRRVMRALMEEDVMTLGKPQESVAIHFTRLIDSEDKSFKYATMETLKFDEHNRIVWPPDFMNDYIKESRRLLDAMYGTQSEEDDDGP